MIRPLNIFSKSWLSYNLMSFSRPSDGRRSVALVVFIGGVTSGELSALRFLSSQVCWDMENIIFNHLVDHLPYFLKCSTMLLYIFHHPSIHLSIHPSIHPFRIHIYYQVFLIAGRNGSWLHCCNHQSCEWQYIAWDTFGHHCQKLMRNCINFSQQYPEICCWVEFLVFFLM